MGLNLIAPLVIAFAFSTSLLAREDYIFVSQDYPPFSYEEGGQATGGMTEIMKETCKVLKYKCEFKVLAMARALKLLEDGEVDGVVSLLVHPDRAVYANFSPAIITSNLVYMSDKESKVQKFSAVKELAGWTIAAVRGASKTAQNHKAEFPSIKLKEEVDMDTMMQRLKNKQYGPKAVIIGSEDVLTYYANKVGVGVETAYLIQEQSFVVAFSKKKVTADELTIFNKAITDLKTNGTTKKILAKYKLRAAN